MKLLTQTHQSKLCIPRLIISQPIKCISQTDDEVTGLRNVLGGTVKHANQSNRKNRFFFVLSILYQTSMFNELCSCVSIPSCPHLEGLRTGHPQCPVSCFPLSLAMDNDFCRMVLHCVQKSQRRHDEVQSMVSFVFSSISGVLHSQSRSQSDPR